MKEKQKSIKVDQKDWRQFLFTGKYYNIKKDC